MRYTLFFVLLLATFAAGAQCKTFRIGPKGDTLDCVDLNDLRQGRWITRVPPLRGEPGYQEEGVYVNGRKEGVWKKFNLMGDPIAVETYRWGNKHGRSLYFTIAGLQREEYWLAVNPDKAFDTLELVDPAHPDIYEKVAVRNEGHSLKHGTWRYFNPNTGALIQTENYILDQLQTDENRTSLSTNRVVSDTTGAKSNATTDKPKPKEVLEFEKKNAGKKVKVRDGRTGG